jgi:hypothetical protein
MNICLFPIPCSPAERPPQQRHEYREQVHQFFQFTKQQQQQGEHDKDNEQQPTVRLLRLLLDDLSAKTKSGPMSVLPDVMLPDIMLPDIALPDTILPDTILPDIALPAVQA